MSISVNLFIGISQNQIETFESIISMGNIEGNNLLICARSARASESLWFEIITSDFDLNNQSEGKLGELRNIFHKVIQYKKVKRKLSSVLSLNNEVTLYCTYIEDVLTNNLFFHPTVNDVVVVEDGILNYYNHSYRSLNQVKFWLKWLICNTLLVRFRKYKGHSSGVNYEKVKQQYLRIPELALSNVPAQNIYSERYHFNPFQDALIIGQEPYINTLGDEGYLKVVKEFYDHYQNIGESKGKVFYKPHRNGPRVKDEIIRLFSEVIYIDDTSPIEKSYFENLKCKYIYSINSSALINIWLQSSDVVRSDLAIFHGNDLKQLDRVFNYINARKL